MRKVRILSGLFSVLAVALSQVMCAVVAFRYAAMLCQVEHGGCSAPASVALLLAIPFVAGIAVCAALAWTFRRRMDRAKNGAQTGTRLTGGR